MTDEQKQLLLDFFKNNRLCVVSSINASGKPESAVVAFSEDNNLNIYFQTANSSRKYSNIVKNSNVSVVIGWSLEDFITIQIEGNGYLVQGSELETVRSNHFAKNPESLKYFDENKESFFGIKPKWIRFEGGQNKFELNF